MDNPPNWGVGPQFYHPLSETETHSRNYVIERTLDAIPTKIESGGIANSDGRMVVEYWTSQDWCHIEAHADVEENLSKRIYAHYMKIVETAI